jgi:hypothetical protein
MTLYVATVAYDAGPLCGSDVFGIHALDEAHARERAMAAFLASNHLHGDALRIRRIEIHTPRHEGDARP